MAKNRKNNLAIWSNCCQDVFHNVDLIFGGIASMSFRSHWLNTWLVVWPLRWSMLAFTSTCIPFRWAIPGPFFDYFLSVFQKMGHPRPLFHLFLSFQTNTTIFTCEKYPSSIGCWDSNPQPLLNESTPITTRPGLHQIFSFFSGNFTELKL